MNNEDNIDNNITNECDYGDEVMEWLQDPNLLNKIVFEIQKKVVGEPESIKTLVNTLCLTKVKNKNSASSNFAVNDASGIGKDFFVFSILETFIPSKNRLHFMRTSARALDYKLSEDSSVNLDSIIIHMEDVDNSVINSSSIKTLMTAKHGSKNKISIVKNNTSCNLEINGKPLMIFTFYKGKLNAEQLRRISCLSLDASFKQTGDILERQAKESDGSFSEEPSEIICKIYPLLKEVEVVVPFAQNLQKALINKYGGTQKAHIILRTSFRRILDFIKASTCLYQYQRNLTETGKYIATKQDYENAREMVLKTTSNKLMIPLSKDQLEIIQIIEQKCGGKAEVNKIMLHFNKFGDKWLRKYLDELVDMGFLEKSLCHDGLSNRPSFLYSSNIDLLNFEMPTFEEISNYSYCTENCELNKPILLLPGS
jgi:predicted transcriptional regulator